VTYLCDTTTFSALMRRDAKVRADAMEPLRRAMEMSRGVANWSAEPVLPL
jgi:hypothetical protein